jgi:hypothetical protein
MNNEKLKYKLEELKKEQSFKVPDNYFNEFPVKMAHLIGETKSKNAYVPFWANIRPKLIPIVVISSMVIIISIFAVHSFSKKELTAQELVDIYKYSAIEETSETDLIKELEKVSEEKNTKPVTKPHSNDKFTNEAIDYLSNENIDVNSLIDAL